VIDCKNAGNFPLCEGGASTVIPSTARNPSSSLVSPPTPTRHFERSKPTFFFQFAPAKWSACAERNLSSSFVTPPPFGSFSSSSGSSSRALVPFQLFRPNNGPTIGRKHSGKHFRGTCSKKLERRQAASAGRRSFTVGRCLAALLGVGASAPT